MFCEAASRAAQIVLLLALFLSCAREPQSATLKDDLGRSVAVPPRVARVITLAPNLTEIVYAVGAGPRLAGTDDFSNHPPEATRLPKVGGMQPNVEKIVQLAPDLVLASTEGNHPNLARALAAAKIPLFVVRTDRVEEIAPAMLRIGALLDAPRGEEAVRALETGMAAQKRARTPAPRVLFAVWTDPLYVAGRGTLTAARGSCRVDEFRDHPTRSNPVRSTFSRFRSIRTTIHCSPRRSISRMIDAHIPSSGFSDQRKRRPGHSGSGMPFSRRWVSAISMSSGPPM